MRLSAAVVGDEALAAEELRLVRLDAEAQEDDLGQADQVQARGDAGVSYRTYGA